MFSSVIFDLDGVIVDSKKVMQKAFAKAYAEVVGKGQPPIDEYLKYVGMSFKSIMKTLKLPENMQSSFAEESNRLNKELKIYSGCIEVLTELQQKKINIGIATGKEGGRARALLQDLNLFDYFDLVIGGDEVRECKPHPDIILKHLEFFAAVPNEVLFIGDSVLDMQAGKSAKVFVGAALWGFGRESDILAESPDYVFEKPLDILSAFI